MVSMLEIKLFLKVTGLSVSWGLVDFLVLKAPDFDLGLLYNYF